MGRRKVRREVLRREAEAAAEHEVWTSGSNMEQITRPAAREGNHGLAGVSDEAAQAMIDAGPRPRPPMTAGQAAQIFQELHFLRTALGRLSKRMKLVEAYQMGYQIAQDKLREGSPAHRNGVHIDSAGRYWMRRPDGWHPMYVGGRLTSLPQLQPPAFPVQRLAEPRDG